MNEYNVYGRKGISLVLVHGGPGARGSLKDLAIILSNDLGVLEINQGDFLSDYDIELYVSDIKYFAEDDDWLTTFGKVMVRWPYKPGSTFSKEWITKLILFEDGIRIDFQITEQEKIQTDRYDNGYEILIDKDKMVEDSIDCTYSEFIIRKPTEEEYNTLVHEFWWDAYFIPKYLWRDELPFAKYMLYNILRYSFIHKIVDWYIGYKNDWSVETGALGKI